MKPAISIRNLHKVYGNKEIFAGFSLCINQGDIVAFFGPNGCGKSTLMSLIAGVLSKDSGSIDLESKNISYIFQNYRESLFPWRTNYQNVAFPLEVKGFSKEEIKARIDELQKIFGLQIDWDSYPYNLSGGQQQMLAFFRALTTKPKILLIDEAFSALDFENNLFLRDKLQKYYLEEKPTILIITHNIEEAVHLGHKIIVLPRAPVDKSFVVENKSSHPRNIDFLTTDSFHKIKDEVLCTFRKTTSV